MSIPKLQHALHMASLAIWGFPVKFVENHDITLADALVIAEGGSSGSSGGVYSGQTAKLKGAMYAAKAALK